MGNSGAERRFLSRFCQSNTLTGEEFALSRCAEAASRRERLKWSRGIQAAFDHILPDDYHLGSGLAESGRKLSFAMCGGMCREPAKALSIDVWKQTQLSLGAATIHVFIRDPTVQARWSNAKRLGHCFDPGFTVTAVDNILRTTMLGACRHCDTANPNEFRRNAAVLRCVSIIVHFCNRSFACVGGLCAVPIGTRWYDGGVRKVFLSAGREL